MLKESIPVDIQSIIISAWSEGLEDKEIEIILPPPAIRKELLAELGITQAPPDQPSPEARDWIAKQRSYQTEALLIIEALHQTEPLTTEQARLGNLPLWSIQKWAQVLLFDWGSGLGNAVEEAKEYLERRKTPTR